MKNIKPKLIELLKTGYCTPQIARLAKKLNEPSTTIHYNIKSLEKENAIKSYKAVFQHKKIDEGLCAYVLVNLRPTQYGNPETMAEELAKHKEVEAIDVIAGNWELIIKVRTKNQEEYFNFLKNVISRKEIEKSISLISMKQFKTDFIIL